MLYSEYFTYIFEGEITSIMDNDQRDVVATIGSDYHDFLIEKGKCIEDQEDPCVGFSSDYIEWFFGGNFTAENVARNAIILGVLLVVVRLGTWIALRYIRFS